MHMLAMLMNFLKHTTSLTHLLRCLYNNLLGSGIDELLQLVIALISSFSKKKLYFIAGLFVTSYITSKLMWQSWAELNNK